MKRFDEIQLVVQERLKKARVLVQSHREKLEREKHRPTPPTPEPPRKPTKTNGKAN